MAKLKDSTNGAFAYPSNQFDLADEWSQFLDDQRHTLNLDGSVSLPWVISSSFFYHFSPGNAFNTIAPGNPFNYAGANNWAFLSTTPIFVAPEAIYGSRAPGYSTVKRNYLRGKAINRLDWRLTKAVKIKEKWQVSGIIEVFNVLNYQNYGTYNSNVGLATFGRPAYSSNLA